MSGCHVIKGNDKPCGNYALKGKTCCWVHKALEDTPYTEKDGEIKKPVVSDSDQCVFLCYNGKRCSRKGLSYQEQKMCSQHKSIVRQQGTQKTVVQPAPVESESEFFTSGKFHKIQLASKDRASGSESDCDDRAYNWFSRAYDGSESEGEPDDYSKDPSYKCSSRSYNRRAYAAKTANGEPRCQFIFDDFVQCSSIDNNNRFCHFHHFHAK